MHADHVEVSWDSSKSQWLARIQSGEEVIRRYCNLPANAEDQIIRSTVIKLAMDEGYEAAPADIAIVRSPAGASA